MSGSVILQELFKDVLVLNVEDLTLESKEEFWLVVDRDLVLQELEKGSIISLEAESESSSVLLILGAQLSTVLDK